MHLLRGPFKSSAVGDFAGDGFADPQGILVAERGPGPVCRRLGLIWEGGLSQFSGSNVNVKVAAPTVNSISALLGTSCRWKHCATSRSIKYNRLSFMRECAGSSNWISILVNGPFVALRH